MLTKLFTLVWKLCVAALFLIVLVPIGAIGLMLVLAVLGIAAPFGVAMFLVFIACVVGAWVKARGKRKVM